MSKREKSRKKPHHLLSFLMAGAGTAAALLAFLQKGMLKVLMFRIWKHARKEKHRPLPENLGVRRPGEPLPLWRSGDLYFNLSCVLGLVSAVFRIVAAVMDGLEGRRR